MRPILNTQFERRQHGFHEPLDSTCLKIPEIVTVKTQTARQDPTTVSTDPARKHLRVPNELADQTRYPPLHRDRGNRVVVTPFGCIKALLAVFFSPRPLCRSLWP